MEDTIRFIVQTPGTALSKVPVVINDATTKYILQRAMTQGYLKQSGDSLRPDHVKCKALLPEEYV